MTGSCSQEPSGDWGQDEVTNAARSARRTPLLVLLAAIVVLAAGLAVTLTAQPPAPAGTPEAATTATDPAEVVSRSTPLGRRTGFSPGAGLLYSSDEQMERELDVVVETGATWLRVDVDWSVVEPERGARDWSRPDRVIDAARERGLDVVALLAYTPAWARPDGTTSHHPPDDPARFADFAGAAAARYAARGVRTYEVWNEPNIPTFWEPRPDVDAYARLLVPAAAAVRAAASGLTVLTGGLSPASDDEGSQIDPRTFVRRLYELDVDGSFDAVAVHPYGFPLLASDPEDYNTFQKLADVRATMVLGGDAAKTVWLTEVGAPTGTGDEAVSEDRQAEIVLDAVRSADVLPWTGPVFLYSVRDAGDDRDDREDNFGLVRRDFSPKPAWRRLRALLRDSPTPTPTGGS